MNNKITIALAQIDLIVGDIAGNTTRILDCCKQVKLDSQADLIVFPELSISGYPPEDLLLHSGLKRRVAEAIEIIRMQVSDIAVLIGFPEYAENVIYNSCVVFENTKEIIRYRKHVLPNYSVFDEKRYFEAGNKAAVFKIKGTKIGINICEDIWYSDPAKLAKAAGAELIIVINGSPYEKDGQLRRELIVRKRISEVSLPVVYLNMVGGQDELIFDGTSFVMNSRGEITYRAPSFEEKIEIIEFNVSAKEKEPLSANVTPRLNDEESVYKALVKGTRDYINKHKFPGVVLGLSGGIDSALTLAIACDALGPKLVRAVMMPSPYTSKDSLEDAELASSNLGVDYSYLDIKNGMNVIDNLAPLFEGLAADLTEENIQSRLRGLLLMAISNKKGHMLLTTGNKSEVAVGYSTIYGDMAGGFNPIKDLYKTRVFDICKWRNENHRPWMMGPAGVMIEPHIIDKSPR